MTAPAIFALQSSSAEELEGLIEDEFQEEGSLQHAVQLVHESGGIAAAHKLARQEADLVRPVSSRSTLTCSPSPTLALHLSNGLTVWVLQSSEYLGFALHIFHGPQTSNFHPCHNAADMGKAEVD